jgi:hypothetical protein
MYLGDIIDPVQAPGDTRLVRDHGDRDPGLIEPGDRLGGARDELDTIDGAHVAVVHDDRAVAIQKNARTRTQAGFGEHHITQTIRYRLHPASMVCPAGTGRTSHA